MNHVELLAPAGDFDALVAAVENGADAVYLGGQAFNARRNAGNFDAEALVRAVDYCHERGKRVYVTVNTLVKPRELDALTDLAEQLYRAGADAAIVQDWGVAARLRAMLPGLELHASTQMAIHNRQGVEMAQRMGFDRVVLAREMSLPEIRECAETGMALEAFCHGALCVSCSGQCLFSSLVGGRSGNRGLCAQPCRLPYRLTGATATAEGYLLSPRDLYTLPFLAELCAAGVSSLKIEGRMKRPEYVAVVTDAYRRALDGQSRPEDERSLRQIFNRGDGTDGYYHGVIDARLATVDRPNHKGCPVGRVASDGRVTLTETVRSDDALVWRAPQREDCPVSLSGRAGETLHTKAHGYTQLVRLVSASQMEAARDTVRKTRQTVDVTMTFSATIDQPSRLTISDGVHTLTATGASAEVATGAGLTAEAIESRMARTGDTPYRLTACAVTLDGSIYLSVAALNQLRRAALEALSEARRVSARTVRAFVPLPVPAALPTTTVPRVSLIAQSGRGEILRALRDAGADEVAFAPDDVREAALDRETAGLSAFALVLPPTLGGASLDGLYRWACQNQSRITAVYHANIAHFARPWPGECRLDAPLNVGNPAALAAIPRPFTTVTPSLEWTAGEIAAMGGNLSLMVYGRIPLMQLRHCPMHARCRDGNPHRDCRFCDHAASEQQLNAHQLVDRKNIAFPLRRLATPEGCVIRILNSVPLMLLHKLDRLPPASAWRMAFGAESIACARAVVQAFRRAADGQSIDDDPVWEFISKGETTSGHYFRGVE